MSYLVTSSFMVAEQADGSYIVFPPSSAPTSKPLKKPTDLFGVYSVIGDLKYVHRNMPPLGPTTARNRSLLGFRGFVKAAVPSALGDYDAEYLDMF